MRLFREVFVLQASGKMPQMLDSGCTPQMNLGAKVKSIVKSILNPALTIVIFPLLEPFVLFTVFAHNINIRSESFFNF